MPNFRVVITNGSGVKKERIGIPSGSKEELVGVYEASDFIVEEIHEMTPEELQAHESSTMDTSIEAFKGVDIPKGGLMLDENNQPIQPQQNMGNKPEVVNESDLVGVDNAAYASKLLKQNYNMCSPDDFVKGSDVLDTSKVGSVQYNEDTNILPQSQAQQPQPVSIKPKYFKRGGLKFKQVGDELFIEEYVEVDTATYKLSFDDEKLKDILGELYDELYDELGPGLENMLSNSVNLSVLDWVKADEEDEDEDE